MTRFVLLPGLDGTGALFEPLVRHAAREDRVEVVPLSQEPLDYSKLTDRVAPACALTPDTVLVAESFSGPLAIELAVRTSIAALVLCNTFVSPPLAPHFAKFAHPTLFRLKPPAKVVRHFLVGLDAPKELVAQVRDTVASVPAHILASRVRCVLGVDARAVLARCTSPVLYLRGTQDRLMPERNVDELCAAAAQPPEVVRLPAPHLLFQTIPAQAWQAIHRFLASRSMVADAPSSA